ncbi:uncharacterized protein J3D65DRAFT_625922 [Phyllosticta citribraziliensis]|uniref:WD repeat protein n=1 Tax=Phyllosticta citribraziliensis TaxID=989973 RepID=A0ABR1LQT4_9PEZI
MAADNPRRPPANAPSSTPSSSSIVPAPPPPAPPLPPQRSAARNAFTRFVAQSFTSYGSRPPSAQASRPDAARITNPLAPRIPGLSTLSSQDASHKTGLEISAVHINHDRTHAVLAGKEILKTIRITDTKCAEETNLRAAIINYASHHTSAGSTAPTRHRDTLEIHDVKWSHGNYSSHIATAAASGKVVLYDLNRTGVELAQLHEHHRQVHKLAFNPHQGYLLLSGSRDSTVRLWDLRDMKKEIMSCPSRDRYSGQSEGIRDVAWSPTDGVEFAFGTENGVIQRWDTRMNRAPKLKLNAHDKTCYSIDWHPDGKHLASAGADKTVRIWDFSSEQRRQKPVWTIRTPHPVFHARWRLPFQDQDVFQCTHLVTAYDRDHPVVHVWDFRRPSLPFRELSLYQTAPADLLWRTRDLLWTVGREGIFTQSDVRYAPKVVDRRNMSAFALSSTGDLSAFSQRRGRHRTSGTAYDSPQGFTVDEKGRKELSDNSLPRNSADDSVDDAFLSSSLSRHHGRTASNRSTKSISTTPPSSDHVGRMMYLSESLAGHEKYSWTPNQAALRGVAPGSINVPLYTYMAQKYKRTAIDDQPTIQGFGELQQAFEANAKYAQKAGSHRLASSWRVVGQIVSDAVQQRAEANRRRRLENIPATQPKPLPPVTDDTVSKAYTEGQEQLLHPAVRAIQATETVVQNNDSSSQLPTPIARPVTQTRPSASGDANLLPDPEQGESLALPPSLVDTPSQQRDRDQPQAAASAPARRRSVSFQTWSFATNDLEDRAAMIGGYRAPPRIPLSLEPVGPQTLDTRPDFDRHNSGESFAMFSASTDSRGLSVPGSYASIRSQSRAQNAESLQERWEQQSVGPALSSFGANATSADGQGGYMGSSSSIGADVQTGPRNIDGSAPGNGVSPAPYEPGPGARPTLASVISNAGTIATGSGSEQSRVIHDMETLRRQNQQLMRHSSSESDAFTSIQGSFSETSVSNVDMMDASGTIVPEGPAGVASPKLLLQPPGLPEIIDIPAVDDEGSHELTLSDYCVKHEDLDSEVGVPLTLIDMLNWLLEFHSSILSDAQTISHMLFMITEFLPHTHPLPETLTSSILNDYGNYLASISMSPANIRVILDRKLTPLAKSGINPLQAESILQTYHSQLLSLGLFNASAWLRRVAYPTYPAVYEQALQETQIGLRCQQCKNPINNPADKMLCENCKRRQAPCPICWSTVPPDGVGVPLAQQKKKGKRGSSKSKGHQRGKDSIGSISIPRTAKSLAAHAPQPDPVLTSTSSPPSPTVPSHHSPQPTLYTSCSLCGHTAHTTCLRAWHAELDSFAPPTPSPNNPASTTSPKPSGTSSYSPPSPLAISLSPSGGGTCPSPGCLCDCIDGPLRRSRVSSLQQRRAEADRGRVRDDGRRVRESDAARRAAGLVAGAALRGGGAGAGPGLAGIPDVIMGGRRGRERERERPATAFAGSIVGGGGSTAAAAAAAATAAGEAGAAPTGLSGLRRGGSLRGMVAAGGMTAAAAALARGQSRDDSAIREGGRERDRDRQGVSLFGGGRGGAAGGGAAGAAEQNTRNAAGTGEVQGSRRVRVIEPAGRST